MDVRRSGVAFAGSMVLALVLGGCSDSDGNADAGEMDSGLEDAGGTTAFRSIGLAMTGMDPHVDQRMEFQILGGGGNLVFRGILDGLAETEYTYEMPNTTPPGMHQLDFYADLNMNGSYDSPPDDHAWREQIETMGDRTVQFDHNTNFTDISLASPHSDFAFEATGMDPHVGQLFELRVIDATTGQVVGRYVEPAIEGASFSFTIPGILQQGRDYQVDYFADLNENGSYDAPPTDHAWRRTVTADASGASVTFPHDTDFTGVGF